MNVETMRLLVAKGLSAADILEIAETMDCAPAPRSSGAERQARYRARKKEDEAACDVTRDVTRDDDGDVTSVTEPSLPLLPNENNSNPTTPTHPEKQTPRPRKGHRLPADWQPKPLPEALAAAVALWPPGALDRELDRLRDWAASATGPNAVKSDWDAAWRNWIRKIDDEGRYRNGTSRNTGRSPSPRDAGRPKDGAIAYLDRKHGFDGGSPPAERRDAGEGGGDRQRALTGPRSMW